MAFIGFFGDTPDALHRLHVRASYLYAPVLHLSLSGAFALAYSTDACTELSSFPMPRLTVALDGACGGQESLLNVSRLYLRHGRRMRNRLLAPVAFAICDVRKNLVLLGATYGRRCYVEEEERGFWFSSDPALLRAPCSVELAVLKKK